MRIGRTVTIVTLALAAIGAAVSAQQAGFTRTVLQQIDLSVPGREVVSATVEINPGVSIGRHSHPGEEVGYIIDGTVSVEQDGRPAMTLGAGKAFLIPAGVVHNATNTGSAAAHLLVNYIVEKGKPLATPAPAK